MSRKGGLRAGVNNPKTRRGKMAFFDEGGNTSNIDPTKLEDEAKARSDKWFPLERNAVTGRAKLGVSMGEALKASAPAKKQSFREAFAEHKNDPSGKFTWNGKEYSTAMKGASKPAAPAPASRTSGITPSEFKRVGTTSDGQAIRQTVMPEPSAEDKKRKHDELVAKERSRNAELRAKAAGPRKAPTGNVSRGESRADYARMARLQSTLDTARKNREAIDKPGDWLGDIARRNYAMAPEVEAQRRGELTFLRNKYNLPGMASGGSVDKYSKMEKEHVRQMKMHGVPEKYVKEEEKEAKGMKCGGKVMKYAKGGGIESKGKTQGKMVKMASGGSVSARADGIASRGKTNCKMR